MTTINDEAKVKAIRTVLRALNNPLVLMSVPDRELAFNLAAEYQVTAIDLLETAHGRARNT
jgi:hypothetical protein